MPRRDSNGAAWRKARARVLHAEDVCALCGGLVDKDLPALDPMAPQIDHILAFAVGGGNERGNLQLTHRACNRRKGDGRTPRPAIVTSRAW